VWHGFRAIGRRHCEVTRSRGRIDVFFKSHGCGSTSLRGLHLHRNEVIVVCGLFYLQ
jgi:hypothetical protein